MKVEDIANLYYKAGLERLHVGGAGYRTYVLDPLGHVIAETNGPEDVRSLSAALISAAVNAIPTLKTFHDALVALVDVGEPADDNHIRYACCGNYYGEQHTPTCPYIIAYNLINTYDIG